MAKFAYDQRRVSDENLYGMPGYVEQLGPNPALMTPTGATFDRSQPTLTQAPMPQQPPPMQQMPQGAGTPDLAALAALQGQPQQLPGQEQPGAFGEGGRTWDVMSKIGDLMQNLGLQYQALQGNQGAMNMLQMKQQGKMAKQKQLQEALKAMMPKTTNKLTEYKAYVAQEKEAGRSPMSMFEWDRALRASGAGGQPPVDPAMQAIQTKIMGKIAEKLGGDKKPPAGAPGKTKSSKTKTAAKTGFVDVGDGIKIKFGG